MHFSDQVPECWTDSAKASALSVARAERIGGGDLLKSTMLSIDNSWDCRPVQLHQSILWKIQIESGCTHVFIHILHFLNTYEAVVFEDYQLLCIILMYDADVQQTN